MNTQPHHFNAVIRKDEHVLSMLARHHMLSGYRTYRTALKGISTDLSRQYPSAVDRPIYHDIYTSVSSDESYIDFLKAHTLFNVYEPFMPKQVKNLQGETILYPSSYNRFNTSHEWRFCLSCVADNNELGEMPYFQLAHQLPSVSVCHKHQERLYSSCTACHINGKNIDRIGCPAGSHCQFCNKELSPMNSYLDDDMDWLHRTLLKLLSAKVIMPEINKLLGAYQHALGINKFERGFTVADRNRLESLQLELDNHFDPRLYHAIFNNCDKSNFIKRTPSLHLYKAAYQHKTFFSPVVHLLIIRMLFGDIDNIPLIN